MNIKFENAGIVGLIVGIAGVVWAGIVTSKCNKIADKVGLVVDDIANGDKIQIKDSMIEHAVQNAVDRATTEAVSKATEKAVAAVTTDISKQVADAVSEAYDDVKDEVKEKLEAQIGNINIDRVKREIVSAGKEKAARVFGESLNEIRDEAKAKFDSELTDILTKHNNELNSVNKIYSSIANSFGNSGGTTLRIG